MTTAKGTRAAIGCFVVFVGSWVVLIGGVWLIVTGLRGLW